MELILVEAKEEVPDQDVHCNRLDVFTELRTVPLSEYPQLEGVKYLEKTKPKKRKLDVSLQYVLIFINL